LLKIKEISNTANKKSPEPQTTLDQQQQQQIAKRFWTEQLSNSQHHPIQLDANIENISANINRMDSERLLAIVTQHKLQQQFYSSDESNDDATAAAALLVNQQQR
jgi:hypothetical protein